jgi:hypothetical protein
VGGRDQECCDKENGKNGVLHYDLLVARTMSVTPPKSHKSRSAIV